MKKALNSVRNQGSAKRVLITGIAGFAGSHLAEFLLSKKFEVFGFYLPGHSTANVDHIKDKINLIPCDLVNKKDVDAKVIKINPDYVFHLAAFASPAESFKNPKTTLENNIFAELNLLAALVKIKSQAKILVVGSADEYGNVDPKDLPIAEETSLAPPSPYAVSKVAQDLLGLQFFLHHNLNIVRVRPFNHIGPRQSPHFVVSAFASQIADLETKGGGTIRVGNLETWREFTDVRDMARAYFLALEKAKVGGVYNVGTGKPIKIAQILKILLSLSYVKIKVVVDKKLYRPVDIVKIYCDSSKFRKETGWRPKINIEKTLSDTIDYERKKQNG